MKSGNCQGPSGPSDSVPRLDNWKGPVSKALALILAYSAGSVRDSQTEHIKTFLSPTCQASFPPPPTHRPISPVGRRLRKG